MHSAWIRASVALEREQEPETFLSALEEELGRAPEAIRYLRSAGVLILRLTAKELERVRRMPGVRRAEAEGRCELPPRPVPPGRERE